MLKECTRCKETKSAKLFHKRAQTKDGLHYACKSCRKQEALERSDKIKEYNRKYHKSKYDAVKKNLQLLHRFGITREQYNELLKSQNNVCAICSKEDKKMLSVDHNHDTGKIRGLLCDPCNRGLGFFRDSPDNLQRAYQYLVEKGHYG